MRETLMPFKPARPCAVCGALTNNKERYCDAHLKQRQQQTDERRGTPTERGYDSRWQKARLLYLSEHPLCVMCLAHDTVTAGTTVDHVIPHKGNQELFWNESNWQTLCTSCHSKKTATTDGAFGNT